MKSSSKGVAVNAIIIGCGIFVFVVAILFILSVLSYTYTHLRGAPQLFPPKSLVKKGGKLKEDCEKYLKGSEKYIDLINQYADKYNVDPALVAAIVEQESTWNPNAYRYEPLINDASYGLMQTLYGTAKGM